VSEEALLTTGGRDCIHRSNWLKTFWTFDSHLDIEHTTVFPFRLRITKELFFKTRMARRNASVLVGPFIDSSVAKPVWIACGALFDVFCDESRPASVLIRTVVRFVGIGLVARFSMHTVGWMHACGGCDESVKISDLCLKVSDVT
jgi:hypothetical protein